VARSVNILLVEDDPNDVMLIRKAVQKTLSGIPLAVVSNGQEAIDYLKGEGQYGDRALHPFPDIVLLDLKMPLMNGFEVLRWVRQQPRLKRLPVIVLTGSVQDNDARLAYELGANSYVIKPTDFNQLIETMRTLTNFWVGGTKLPDAGPL
jgi:CheY-like chemotaxis protein